MDGREGQRTGRTARLAAGALHPPPSLPRNPGRKLSASVTGYRWRKPPRVEEIHSWLLLWCTAAPLRSSSPGCVTTLPRYTTGLCLLETPVSIGAYLNSNCTAVVPDEEWEGGGGGGGRSKRQKERESPTTTYGLSRSASSSISRFLSVRPFRCFAELRSYH